VKHKVKLSAPAAAVTRENKPKKRHKVGPPGAQETGYEGRGEGTSSQRRGRSAASLLRTSGTAFRATNAVAVGRLGKLL